MKLYSVLDKATGAYNQPFTQPTHAAAVRVIKNEMEQPQSMLAKHPTDFELWHVGDFSEEDGRITPALERVVGMHALVANQVNNGTEG